LTRRRRTSVDAVAMPCMVNGIDALSHGISKEF
jgi:hypothetical protein